MGLLSVAIWLPIAVGAILLALGRDDQAKAVRWLALIGAIASFLVTLPLLSGFDSGTAAMQFVENYAWIERFNIRYHLGVDGISVWFVLLTAFITIIVVIAAWEVITDRVNQYMGAFLILSGVMVGVFSALDGLLFYVFFEATLIPMYIIIGVWGGPRRVYAAFKFFLYTLLGSLLMLVALLYLYYKSGGSFQILDWHKLPLPLTAQSLLLSEGFYWDLNDKTREWSKRLQKASPKGTMPSMDVAGVYAGIQHYLKAMDALGGNPHDGAKVVAKMKEMPTDDPLFGKGSIRADGRKIHPAYLFEVKSPAESRGPWDFYKLVETIPAKDAFRPLADGNCPMVKK